MEQEKIGKFIAKCRKDKKITQQELAEKLGVSDRTIGNWENGRNMPDLSLFKPICDELDITINDFLNGEIVNKEESKEEYINKSEKNIVNTIEYSQNIISKLIKKSGYILMLVGILISVSALTVFNSDSSWGSIYSIFGSIIALIGVSKFTKKFNYQKRTILNFSFYVTYLLLLFLLDFLSVIYIKQAPRFSYLKETGDNVILYKSIFYNVYRINYNTENEYYIIDLKREYTSDTVPITFYNREKSGIDNILKYKNSYIGNNANISNLVGKLPLSEYGYVIEIDSKNFGLTIDYHITDWYINNNYYLEKSLIYNSVSLFLLIDNLEYIVFNFSGNSYKITREDINEKYKEFNKIKNSMNDNSEKSKKSIKESFNKYVEQVINNEYVEENFSNMFI